MRSEKDITDRLAAADVSCARGGANLTALRRTVFSLILAEGGPVGAYTLLDRLKATRRAAPPTIYRALDFLVQQGLVHRVERLNAFVPCEDAGHHGHAVQFLICNTCGGVDEVENHEITKALQHAAQAQGFVPRHATVEVEGTCADCARLPA